MEHTATRKARVLADEKYMLIISPTTFRQGI